MGGVVVAVLGFGVLAPAAALAGVSGATVITLPSAVTVGQTGVHATMTLTNLNTNPGDSSANTVCNAGDTPPCTGPGITLFPSCGSPSGATCLTGFAEGGVFVLAPLATGSRGGCAGTIFNVSNPGGTTATVRPQNGNVVLLGNGSSCDIDLTLSVIAMPQHDADPVAPGVQTDQVASATQTSGGLSSPSFATSATTVNKATPALATNASGNVTLGAGTLTDTATVTGRGSPVAGATVLFVLYGPGDTTCATPIFSSTNPVDGAGVATSAAATPTTTGTYRWIATYSGDANNAPVAGACNDPGESVTVTPVPSPPPPPPPPLPDRDRDGIPDVFDRCPDAPDSEQADSDHDGIGNACENSEASPGPTLGATVVLRVLSGTVLVRPPSDTRYRRLRGAELIPMGTFVDARNGTLALSSAPTAAKGASETIDLTGAVFQITQRTAARPYTDINLHIPTTAEACPRTGAQAAAVSPTRAKLSANGKGRFRIRARNSRSTAPGTIWTTEERCDATVTTVEKGRVEVADKRTRTLVAITAGQSYVARAGAAG